MPHINFYGRPEELFEIIEAIKRKSKPFDIFKCIKKLKVRK